MYQRNVFYTCLIIALFSIPLAIDFISKYQRENSNKSQPENRSIEFWQYWAGEEKAALVNLVEKFNREKHGFTVKVQSISLPRKKIMMAVAANLAPDLVLLDGDMVSDFALRKALIPFNRIISQNESLRKQYQKTSADLMPSYLNMLAIPLKEERVKDNSLSTEPQQVALPLMPTVEALHINKTLLKKYNLGSPESLEDLITISKKISKESNFSEFGYLATWPVWSGRFIVTAFNGNWHKANSEENIAAWNWVLENFIKDAPPDKLQGFIEGNISYQSPDNPFYSGKLALETSGVWEYGFTKKFAPQYEIEIKKFPKMKSLSGSATEIAVDALSIPRSAKHPEEALYFILWLLKKENLSYLALAQKKFPPIRLSPEEKADFINKHPNPYIKTFMDLAEESKDAYFPHFSFSKEYKREIKKAYDKVLRREMSPREALNELERKKEQMERH